MASRPSKDPLARIRAFPTGSRVTDDPNSIGGNVSAEHKRLAVNTLSYHIAHFQGSKAFAHDAVKGLKLVEINVKKKGEEKDPAGGKIGEISERGEVSARDLGSEDREKVESEATFEVLVEEGMLNVHGTLAGACATHLLDFCTFGAMFSLGFESGFDASGVSTSMNLQFHSPALPGMLLRIVATSISSGGKLSACRAEIYDQKTEQLLVSVVHHMAPLRDLSRRSKSRL